MVDHGKELMTPLNNDLNIARASSLVTCLKKKVRGIALSLRHLLNK